MKPSPSLDEDIVLSRAAPPTSHQLILASRFFSCLLAASLLVGTFSGCALFRHRKAKPDPRLKEGGETQFAGTITMVNLDDGFVVIDNGSQPSPAVGRTVKSRVGTSDPVEMKVTEVRRRPFVVADIVKGVPQKGDTVYQAPQ